MMEMNEEANTGAVSVRRAPNAVRPATGDHPGATGRASAATGATTVHFATEVVAGGHGGRVAVGGCWSARPQRGRAGSPIQISENDVPREAIMGVLMHNFDVYREWECD